MSGGPEQGISRSVTTSANVKFDWIERTLWRDGRLLRPPRKVFALISYLVRNRHRVVEKRELAEVIWPCVKVSESCLRWLIKESRRWLGDNGADQRFVRTNRGLGVRWVAEIDDGGAPPLGVASDAWDMACASSRVCDPARCEALIRFVQGQLNDGHLVEALQTLLEAVSPAPDGWRCNHQPPWVPFPPEAPGRGCSTGVTTPSTMP